MAFGHGKVILFGEHAVVHGYPALAKAIPNGAEVTFAPAAGASRVTTLHIAPWDVTVDTGSAPNVGHEKLQEALKRARAFYDDDLELALHAVMHIRGGVGVGSSAALGVAVLRALDQARGLHRPDEEIFERSFTWERVFHGNPGGVDNAMATYGDLAIFRRGQPLQRLRLPVGCPLYLVAAVSGPRPPVAETVASVARQYAEHPERVKKTFEAIEAIVTNGKSALERCDMKSLGQLMILNHKLLAGLMLSTERIERMNEAAIQAGALGAKVTGGGGGGCMIALSDNAETRVAVKAALSEFGPVFDV